MQQAECELSDIDALILGNGPGSFIGLRIAASVAQGLCYGSGMPLVPVSSLAAVAMECISEHSASKVLVAQDARMNEVYLGAYQIDSSGLPVPVGDVTLQPATAIQSLSDGTPVKWTAAGEGWHRYPTLFAANRHHLSSLSDIRLPRARFLLAPGARALQRGQSVDPVRLVPAYVRHTVAKVPLAAQV